MWAACKITVGQMQDRYTELFGKPTEIALPNALESLKSEVSANIAAAEWWRQPPGRSARSAVMLRSWSDDIEAIRRVRKGAVTV